MTDNLLPTPEHLLPMQAAARILCQLDGVNPDESTPTPHPLFPGVTQNAPAWHAAAEYLLTFTKALTALKMAHEQQTPQAVAPTH